MSRTSTPARVILVVDDDKLTLLLLAELLGARGYDVATAADGTTALRVASQRTPDLVLLDLSMPRMDGYSVASALRQEVSDKLPIIALTGTMPSDDPNAEYSGFTDWIQKPFEVSGLMATVQRHLGPGSS